MHSEESSKTRIEIYLGDVPGGPVPSSAGGEGSVPGWGAKIWHASWPKNQSMKNRSNIVTNSKNGPHLKKKKQHFRIIEMKSTWAPEFLMLCC